MSERKRLTGYISLDALDEWADDFSHWSGEITFPDPEGANLAWSKTIEMVEKRPGEAVLSREELKETLKRLVFNNGYAITADELAFDLIRELFPTNETEVLG